MVSLKQQNFLFFFFVNVNQIIKKHRRHGIYITIDSMFIFMLKEKQMKKKKVFPSYIYDVVLRFRIY